MQEIKAILPTQNEERPIRSTELRYSNDANSEYVRNEKQLTLPNKPLPPRQSYWFVYSRIVFSIAVDATTR